MRKLLIVTMLLGCGGSDSNTPSGNTDRTPIDPYPTLSANDHAIVDAFNAVTIDCPERVWPSYDWTKFQVMLVSNEEQRALLWNDQSNRQEPPTVTEVDYSTLPDNFIYGEYDLTEWQGADTLSLSLDQERLDLETLGFHEGFHYFGQRPPHWNELHGERDGRQRERKQ